MGLLLGIGGVNEKEGCWQDHFVPNLQKSMYFKLLFTSAIGNDKRIGRQLSVE